MKDPQPSIGPRYFALSYCWGKSQSVVTTPSKLAEHKMKMPLEKFPATIRDAILITRRLGARYLWVDAVCILQGSSPEARKDWETGSPKMSEIYGNAFLTIVAAAASDVSEGILANLRQLNKDSTPFKMPFKSTLSPSIVGDMFIQPYPRSVAWSHWAPLPENEPLSSRGWVLQERILSSRLVTYKADAIHWEFLTCRRSELDPTEEIYDAGPGKALESHYSGGWRFPKDHTLNPADWRTVLQEYTIRSITVPGDKLPAISGIAKLFSQATADNYIAGLWKSALPGCLLWSTGTGGPVKVSRAGSYRAPSWSWASLEGEIVLFWGEMDQNSVHSLRNQPTSDRLSEILESVVVNNGPDVYGAIINGWLVVSGPLRQVKVLRRYKQAYGRLWPQFDIDDMKTEEKSDYVSIDMLKKDTATDEELEELSNDLWCLALIRKWSGEVDESESNAAVGGGGEEGLLLTHTGEGALEFKRVGTFKNVTSYQAPKFNIAGWERHTIKII